MLLGVDIGGTKLCAVRVDERGNTLARIHRPVATNAADLLADVQAAINELRTPEIKAVGIGVAGLVRWPSGHVVWGPHLPFRDLDLRQAVSKTAGLPVIVDNDANTAAHAEVTAGALEGVDNGAVLTLGTGIGCGFVLGGQVYRGGGFAGEVGHLIVDRSGPLCKCGQRGCWETLASGRVLTERAREIAGDATVDGAWLNGPAQDGNAAAKQAIETVGREFGRGIASLNTALDLSRIAVGGAVINAGALLLEPAREALKDAYAAEYRSAPELVLAKFGPDAGAIGAALLSEAAVRSEAALI